MLPKKPRVISKGCCGIMESDIVTRGDDGLAKWKSERFFDHVCSDLTLPTLGNYQYSSGIIILSIVVE